MWQWQRDNGEFFIETWQGKMERNTVHELKNMALSWVFTWGRKQTQRQSNRCRLAQNERMCICAYMVYSYVFLQIDYLFLYLWTTESESYVTTDGQPASLSWNKAPIWSLRPDLYYLCDSCGIVLDERSGLSFVCAAGPCQRSLSRVRVPWDLRPYYFLFVASYDSQGHGGGIRPRLHTVFFVNNCSVEQHIQSRETGLMK
jgi:hypothetical protein